MNEFELQAEDYNEVDGLRAFMVMDPRIDLNEVPYYNILKGGQYIRYNQNISSSYSNSSAQFSVVPPSKDIAVDKKIYIDVGFQFVFTGDAGAGNTMLPSVTVGGVEYLAGQTDALRFMAFQQVVESLSITFNTTTVSQNLSDYIEAITRAGFSKEYENTDLSIAPSMHDQFQELGDWASWGGSRNPLASWGNNASQQPRGGLKYIITANTQTSATVQVRWSELLLISPLAMGKLEQKGFLGLTNLDFTFNIGNLSRMWSHDNTNNDWNDGAAASSIAVTWLEAPQLRLCYITPPSSEPIPYINKYPYYEINRYPTDTGAALAGGATTRISGSNIQLSSIPKRLFLLARERNADKTFNDADSYARIDGVEIQFNNKNSLLGSATSRDLYEISARNGLQMSWAQWDQFSGSVAVIDFSHDISLDDSHAVGSFGQYSLQVNLDITNIGTVSKQYTFYMIVLSEGIFSIEGTSTSKTVGSVLPHNVLEAMQLGELEHIPYYEQYDYVGGSFLGFLKSVGRKIGKAIHTGATFLKKRALPFMKKYGPAIFGVAAKVAPMLMGLGYEEEEVLKILDRKGLLNNHLFNNQLRNIRYDGPIYNKSNNTNGAGVTGAGVAYGAGVTGGARVSRSRLRNRK